MKKIRNTPQSLKPREKLKQNGILSLTNIELIAILLGSGTKDKDVFALSAKISKIIEVNHGCIKYDHLKSICGIGIAKASTIMAAFELARRYVKTDAIKIESASDILPLVADIADKRQEYFLCITLTGANEVIEKRIITIGLLDKSHVHPREVFADAITDRAAGVIFVHNHPSGSTQPSSADLRVHKQLTNASEILGIHIVDHLIVSKNGYFSFKESGYGFKNF